MPFYCSVPGLSGECTRTHRNALCRNGNPFGSNLALEKAICEIPFRFDPSDSKRNRLTSTMDALNRKYGTATIFSISMLLARAAAPTRIAFTSIPDLF